MDDPVDLPLTDWPPASATQSAPDGTLAARLAQSEGWLSSISNSLPGYVWMADSAGQLTFTTQAWLNYAGSAEDETLGSGWGRFIHADDLPRVVEAWTRSIQEWVPYSIEFRCRRWDGTFRWFMSRAEPERDASGAVVRWVGINVDIEHQKTAEAAVAALNATLEHRVAEATLAREQTEAALRQAQKMEAIGQLTGGIAHDFNNMLQSVLGSLDLIGRRLEQGRHAEVPRLAEIAIQGATRAATLTARLLSFARRQALAPRALDANALVTGMAELVRNTVGASVTVELALAPALPPILCDANQMENAILNLAINARDAMPRGGALRLQTTEVVVTEADVVGHPGVVPGPFIELSMTDSGTGMPPEVLARAFEPFFTTKPIGLGTGLGLSQLYGFVRQSGGLVQLESAPGQGTSVRLQFPRLTGSAAGQSAAPVSARATILLVEDEEAIRNLAREALTEQGWTVLEAGTGAAALMILESSAAVDLLITDVGLPGGLNGRQLAEAARQSRPGLPVLYMTGQAETALSTEPLPLRTTIISKPFRLSVLTERVTAVLAAA